MFSCGNNYVTTNEKFVTPYTVDKIMPYTNNCCIYTISTRYRTDYRYKLEIIDTIGKFNVCDTVYINFSKPMKHE